jgi:hypothetical protein
MDKTELAGDATIGSALWGERDFELRGVVQVGKAVLLLQGETDISVV